MKKIFSTKVIVFILLSIAAIALIYPIYNYNSHNFRGKVINKYVTDTPFHSISLKTNIVIIRYWKGEEDFVINNNETFQKLEIGQEYDFKKEKYVDWLELK